MQCINPLKAGFDKSGKLTFSSRKADKNLEAFAFECRKCLPCRLNNAREKAIRCYHEVQIVPNSIFLTLTYAPEHLLSPRLQYGDFQNFIKDLRNLKGYEPENRIRYVVTGEYGEKFKRPHWHAILFNYSPSDKKHFRTTELGHDVYRSHELSSLWSQGFAEFGEVTLDSANYVSRYAAKKLVHGKDADHDYHPLHKTSSRRAIGRSWIEKYWEQTFRNGFVVLNGSQMRIPRYYVDWLQKHKPDEWVRYVTEVRPKIQKLAQEKERKELEIYIRNRMESPDALPRRNVKETILKTKFKRLQEYLKL